MRFNIFSGSTDGNGLAAALTNPTTASKRKGNIRQQYPVEFSGRVWDDAEVAYTTLCRRLDYHTDVVAADDLMVDIIAAKLRQHPRLGEAVRQRGGVAFLEQCEHQTGARSASFRAWEGYGRESRFIRNLIAAYERWEASQL